jgi:hypothetical protein
VVESGNSTGSDTAETLTYAFITTIPKGARKVEISETVSESSSNFIALALNSESDATAATAEGILNWNYRIQWTGKYRAKTFTIDYVREAQNFSHHVKQVPLA